MFKKIRDVPAILQSIKELLLRICKRIDDYKKSRMNIRNSDLIFVSFKSDGVYLNDIKFIDKKATLQRAIFDILIEHYKNEISCGSCYIQISKICDHLRNVGIDSCNLENQINASIYRMRNAAHKIINSNNLIESSKWNGYRFYDGVFIERKRQM